MSSPRRRRAGFLAKLIVLAGSLLFCLLLVEIVARVIVGRGTMHLGTEMWKYAKYAKVRPTNPEIGHRNRPNVDIQLMGVNVKTESHGLRDPERSPQKPPGTYRIMVLGDSITFGWGVPYEQTFPRLLEKSLNANPPVAGQHYEVINTGVGNLNTAMEVAWFKEEGLKFSPDLVLLGWFLNDAEPTPIPTHNPLAYHSFAYVWLDSALDSLMRNTNARQSYREYYSGLFEDSQPGWQKCQRSLDDLAAVCAAHQIPWRVLLIPELHTQGKNYEFTAIHDKIRAICARLKVPSLELLDSIPEDGKPEQWWVCPSDAHPNGMANERMAALIDQKLREEHWVQ
jgi:lysophospholipase L1-like esterase